MGSALFSTVEWSTCTVFFLRSAPSCAAAMRLLMMTSPLSTSEPSTGSPSSSTLQ